jgi:hypothetical protein
LLIGEHNKATQMGCLGQIIQWGKSETWETQDVYQAAALLRKNSGIIVIVQRDLLLNPENQTTKPRRHEEVKNQFGLFFVSLCLGGEFPIFRGEPRYASSLLWAADQQPGASTVAGFTTQVNPRPRTRRAVAP